MTTNRDQCTYKRVGVQQDSAHIHAPRVLFHDLLPKFGFKIFYIYRYMGFWRSPKDASFFLYLFSLFSHSAFCSNHKCLNKRPKCLIGKKKRTNYCSLPRLVPSTSRRSTILQVNVAFPDPRVKCKDTNNLLHIYAFKVSKLYMLISEYLKYIFLGCFFLSFNYSSTVWLKMSYKMSKQLSFLIFI